VARRGGVGVGSGREEWMGGSLRGGGLGRPGRRALEGSECGPVGSRRNANSLNSSTVLLHRAKLWSSQGRVELAWNLPLSHWWYAV